MSPLGHLEPASQVWRVAGSIYSGHPAYPSGLARFRRNTTFAKTDEDRHTSSDRGRRRARAGDDDWLFLDECALPRVVKVAASARRRDRQTGACVRRRPDSFAGPGPSRRPLTARRQRERSRAGAAPAANPPIPTNRPRGVQLRASKTELPESLIPGRLEHRMNRQLAALLEGGVDVQGLTVAVVASGGNLDAETFAEVLGA